MTKKKVFIVEDDPIISSDLSGILADLGYEICGAAFDPFDARKKIEELRPHLILMDVNLGSSIDGIDLAKLINRSGAGIIFITAFTDAATRDRVKEINPLGYIIKPFDDKDIEVALDLAFHKLSGPSVPEHPIKQNADSIFVKTGAGVSRKVNFKDILFMEACDNYSFIYCTGERLMVSYTLKELEERISSDEYARVHRSFVVNISCVESIRNGALVIKDREIPVGKSYREAILKLFPTL